MTSVPVVTVVVAYLNERAFLAEALESIAAQRDDRWEAVLVDDGSTDGSSLIADAFRERYPGQVRCLHHAGYRNLGLPASRNVGARAGLGEFIAFLDADDIWLPGRLEEHTRVLSTHPEVGMVYGRARWWFSWTGEPGDKVRDYEYPVGVPTGTVLDGKSLLRPYFVTQAAVTPNPSGILVRRTVFEAVGGFDESFRGVHAAYEDQAFYAKVLMATSVVALESCSILYRQHAGSITAIAAREGHDRATREYFLKWLRHALDERGMSSIAVRWRLWAWRHPRIGAMVERLAPAQVVRLLSRLLRQD